MKIIQISLMFLNNNLLQIINKSKSNYIIKFKYININ